MRVGHVASVYVDGASLSPFSIAFPPHAKHVCPCVKKMTLIGTPSSAVSDSDIPGLLQLCHLANLFPVF